MTLDYLLIPTITNHLCEATRSKEANNAGRKGGRGGLWSSSKLLLPPGESKVPRVWKPRTVEPSNRRTVEFPKSG